MQDGTETALSESPGDAHRTQTPVRATDYLGLSPT